MPGSSRTRHQSELVKSVLSASALTDKQIDYEAIENLSDDLKAVLDRHCYLIKR